MIDISKLTEKDKGRAVTFELSEVRENGFISSWNDRFIFVKYGVNPQSKATLPVDLQFDITNFKEDADA
ncbi:MAG: hypothetical protein Ta2B_14450 [Termitinemataceae bacterium]|nr:MAG: hypothetical protein Ta2B_14450 [Termitinemataceae bacterium]